MSGHTKIPYLIRKGLDKYLIANIEEAFNWSKSKYKIKAVALFLAEKNEIMTVLKELEHKIKDTFERTSHMALDFIEGLRICYEIQDNVNYAGFHTGLEKYFSKLGGNNLQSLIDSIKTNDDGKVVNKSYLRKLKHKVFAKAMTPLAKALIIVPSLC